MKKFVFFLGGHDAEMCAIRELLEQQGLQYYDKGLTWGAALSEYGAELDAITNETPVLVELKLDIPYPANSIIINHHQGRAGKNMPVSLEQIADMLDIKLNRWQRLIAENDRAHIPGLKAAGATKKEIAEIRAYDRSCQGVTEHEEEQAEQLCSGFESSGELDMLEIPFTHTSPVTDRLYGQYKNLLIITPEDINFFGKGSIVQLLAKQYPDSWYGGNLPDEGFWGMEITDNVDIKNIIQLTRRLF